MPLLDQRIRKSQFALFAVFVLVGIVSATFNQLRPLANTIILGLAANAIAIPLGILMARLCSCQGLFATAVRYVCLSLLFVPLFVHVGAWDAAVGKLGWLTGSSWSINSIPLGSWLIAIWIHAIAAVPMVAIVLWIGISGAGRIYDEQARLDASSGVVFWRVTLPRLFPLIAICAIWIFITCAREIAVTDIYRIGTLAEQIYLGYSLGRMEDVVGPGIAFSTIALVAAMISVWVIPYFDAYPDSEEQLAKLVNKHVASRAERIVGAIVLVGILLVPITNLTTRASFYVVNVNGEPEAKHSIANLFEVVGEVPSQYADEFQWSFLIASVSSLSIVLLAIWLVWNSFNSRFWRAITIVVFAVSCSLPGPVIGSTMLWVRSSIPIELVSWLFDRTIFAPVICNLIFCFPISLILVWFVLCNTARDALEHAELEGVGRWSRLIRISIGGNLAGLAGVLVIIYASCFGELSASQLAVPPGIDTIPRRMLGLLHSGVNDHTAGLTIVNVLFLITSTAVGHVLLYWNVSSRKQ